MIDKELINQLTYEESETLSQHLAEHLVRIYFEGVDRSKVSAYEMLRLCPNFIKEAWGLMTNKILDKDNYEY